MNILWHLVDEQGCTYVVLLQEYPVSGRTGRVLPAGVDYKDAGDWIPERESGLYWAWQRYTDDGYCGALQAVGQLMKQGVRVVRIERHPPGSIRERFLLRELPTVEQADAVASLWAGTAMVPGDPAPTPTPWTRVPGMWVARLPDYEDDTGTEPLAAMMHLQVKVHRKGPLAGQDGVQNTLEPPHQDSFLVGRHNSRPMWFMPLSPAGPITLEELNALVEARRAAKAAE